MSQRPESDLGRYYYHRYRRAGETRHALRLIQRGLCYWCEAPMWAYGTKGVPLMSPWRETIEHLRPKSLGGCNHFENKALVHSHCNQLRGNMWDGTQFCPRWTCWWEWQLGKFTEVT